MDNQTQPYKSSKPHVISFILSLLVTLLAFWAVASEEVSAAFAVPFILLLAVIQVAFQLFYWMHMSERGHSYPLLFLGSGLLVVVVTVIAFAYWVWW
ncbi:cytochrome C oxidase subunit IV family protein [Microaerobacter geothermalis]|uniref:cytochrome C oxidase subunit IV family protein n=1 Tax=Microaerobacter geothermalis TaxID=674972 RepID=UPI001F315232|nr:cytochrome C oxidase subunit IV family protein [Microaerobacter geothermalis]MCF6093640.1 cytochrome C oxidase subunit IV family protein [Microaerobacter geothermalis]